MDDFFQFEDDLFEKRKPSKVADIQYNPTCSGDLSFLSRPDVESQKAACDWLYLHGRYADCLNQADRLLKAHAEDVSGFIKKSYLDCKIRCCLRLRMYDSLTQLLLQHALAVASKEDLLNHFVLHQDCSCRTGDRHTTLQVLQYLILFLPLGCVFEKSHQERPLSPCQTVWWSQVADLWTKVGHCSVEYYPSWFTGVARVFATLTTSHTHNKSEPVGALDNHRKAEDIARQILLRYSSETPLEDSDVFPTNDCPLCTDQKQSDRLARIFYDRFVSPFEKLFQTDPHNV